MDGDQVTVRLPGVAAVTWTLPGTEGLWPSAKVGTSECGGCLPVVDHSSSASNNARCTGAEFSGPRLTSTGHPLFPTRPSVETVERLLTEGKQGLLNFLDIGVPIISAINGPAWRHSELPLLADIVLASDTAQFQDSAHFTGGLVPGDGMHVVYPLLLGANRARYFLLTGQTLSAQQAQELGLVAEVLPADRLMPRAWELADEIARKPASLVRATRAVLTEHIKRHMQDLLGFGLYAEMLALMDRPSG